MYLISNVRVILFTLIYYDYKIIASGVRVVWTCNTIDQIDFDLVNIITTVYSFVNYKFNLKFNELCKKSGTN